MADVLALCVAEPVQIRSRKGEVSVDAYRYGLLAVHVVPGSTMWGITHLPTGLSMAMATGLFPGALPAVEAMMEVSALKNDWLNLEQRDLQTLGPPIRDIGIRHGGIIGLYDSGVGRPDAGLNADVCRRYE